ncbi:hypothetical protein [Pyrobaculum aerophilum]|uniref:Uncharacterized protein n=1 Tax=Pyrobaculum aerophilum TaxID=13773 RepID=A0A371QYC9_9CREN|nr:hypothetical protein [Pyrobaculum aerophilum]RFA95666.1 hypothetical protein CGL51_07175 [Pyrobaculum aerophilum]RFA96122.1 hypothetical protein CGL52_11585 [Pyrobaculum aerophilum]
MKARIAIAILAVALIAVAVAMAYAQNATGTTITPAAKAGWGPGWHKGWEAGWRPGWHKGWAPKGVAGHCGAANITLYTTSRQLTITGDGINVALNVDVVNANATSPYGRIVYGTGTVQLGGNTYTAKSVYGAVKPWGAKLTVYTGNELVVIKYFNGQYLAVVKTFGQQGYQSYNGTATLNIS